MNQTLIAITAGVGGIKEKKIHREDTAFKMPCNSHDMLHPPHPYGGKLTLWQIYEDVRK